MLNEGFAPVHLADEASALAPGLPSQADAKNGPMLKHVEFVAPSALALRIVGVESHESFGDLPCLPVLWRELVRDEPPAGEAGHDLLAAEHYVAAS